MLQQLCTLILADMRAEILNNLHVGLGLGLCFRLVRVSFSVSRGYYCIIIVFFDFVVFCFSKRSTGKNVAEMTYLVSRGT